jgi:Fe-S-cluster-containing hydrogenase component 2
MSYSHAGEEGATVKKLVVVPNLCIGCRECELICSLKHHGVFTPSKARIRVDYDEEMNSYDPVVCRHCDEPACAEACPSGAMTRDDRTGAVIVVDELCTQCLACVDACSYGAIRVADDGSILKCDLCGGAPTCVNFCSKRPEMTGPLADNQEAAKALIFDEGE